MLTNPQSFEQDFDGLIALRSAYESIVKEMEANQLKAHGLAGGNPIKFKGEIRIVPQGVYHIWREMTDSEGKFKWPSDVCAAINRSKVQAEQRKDYRGLTAVSLFFGSYRDTHTKALYSQISQGFKT
ncbi:hypothetical protein DA717_10860 [Piscirickettsiaceae bacterium NZ-RLO2]|nr:hypothetical protein DA717_10860 [Piscirickettsiaceae bacterium NZ-RLO2]